MHREPRYAFALHRVTSCDIGFTHAVPILSFATKTEVDPCQFSSVGGTRGGLRYRRRIALQDQIRGRDGFPRRAGGPETARHWQRDGVRPGPTPCTGMAGTVWNWSWRMECTSTEWSRSRVGRGRGNCCCCDDPRLRPGAPGWLGLANKLLLGQAARPARSDTPAQAINEQPYSLASVSWAGEVIGPYSVAAG